MNEFSSDKTFRLIFRVLIEARTLNLSTKERYSFSKRETPSIIQIIFSEASENILVAKIKQNNSFVMQMKSRSMFDRFQVTRALELFL